MAEPRLFSVTQRDLDPLFGSLASSWEILLCGKCLNSRTFSWTLSASTIHPGYWAMVQDTLHLDPACKPREGKQCGMVVLNTSLALCGA